MGLPISVWAGFDGASNVRVRVTPRLPTNPTFSPTSIISHIPSTILHISIYRRVRHSRFVFCICIRPLLPLLMPSIFQHLILLLAVAYLQFVAHARPTHVDPADSSVRPDWEPASLLGRQFLHIHQPTSGSSSGLPDTIHKQRGAEFYRRLSYPSRTFLRHFTPLRSHPRGAGY